MSLEDLTTAVSELSPEDFSQFEAWFRQFASDQWDRQIEADARAGKLEHLITQADAEYAAGQCTPLRAPEQP